MRLFNACRFHLFAVPLALLGCGSSCSAESTDVAAKKNEIVELNGCGGCKERRGAKTLHELFVGRRIDEEGDAQEEEEPLATDRPDFVEASSNVGRGRVQLEAGYTFIHDRSGGVTTRTHSYPEILLRIGLFADWLELRIGQNFGSQLLHGGGVRQSGHGADDLYLGIGLALTEQQGLIPESRVVFQTTAPTGADAFTDEQMLPGVNILYGWDVIEDKMSLGMSTAFNRARDDSGDYYLEFAQAVTTALTLTEKLGMYLETFALMPAGAEDAGARPEYYADGGFIYRVTNNFQLDIRAGIGLNRHADDFFAGSGFAVRY